MPEALWFVMVGGTAHRRAEGKTSDLKLSLLEGPGSDKGNNFVGHRKAALGQGQLSPASRALLDPHSSNCIDGDLKLALKCKIAANVYCSLARSACSSTWQGGCRSADASSESG